jgi:hypothetical protein
MKLFITALSLGLFTAATPPAVLVEASSVYTVKNADTLTASTCGDSIVSYGWHKLAGPGTRDIRTTFVPQLIVNNLTPGYYIYRCTVTDKNGLSAYDTVGFAMIPAVHDTVFIISGKVVVLHDSTNCLP